MCVSAKHGARWTMLLVGMGLFGGAMVALADPPPPENHTPSASDKVTDEKDAVRLRKAAEKLRSAKPRPRYTGPGTYAGPERYASPGHDFYADPDPPYSYYERHWRREARDYGRARRHYEGNGYRYGPYGQGGWYYGPSPYDYGDEWRGGSGYGYPSPYASPYPAPSFDTGYWEGRRDGRRYAEWERYYESGRRGYLEAMSNGLQAFRNGNYSAAARNFIRAARQNQGDPASRIHLTHALIALGRYHEALPGLRRAFQLQPKIVYLAMDIRKDYGPNTDFEKHLAALRRAAEAEPNDPALWLLLGYAQFYSGRETEALVSLERANELTPGDYVTEALLDAATLITPSSGAHGAKPATPNASKAGPAGRRPAKADAWRAKRRGPSGRRR